MALQTLARIFAANQERFLKNPADASAGSWLQRAGDVAICTTCQQYVAMSPRVTPLPSTQRYIDGDLQLHSLELPNLLVHEGSRFHASATAAILGVDDVAALYGVPAFGEFEAVYEHIVGKGASPNSCFQIIAGGHKVRKLATCLPIAIQAND